ncbi:hypothetical protein NPIL_332291 [Nephila pilipes]|uniref:Uncharacterized protein n=1 Tax=Nephila pilipes TaxID=299642 RepID=A0A8X6TKH2_NEPPI|nr:hypothetical protein NPIL_315101 [Nephila pilipes]GFT27892.1 hypothetical protein NPIL_332291 [Nephila pilipes]
MGKWNAKAFEAMPIINLGEGERGRARLDDDKKTIALAYLENTALARRYISSTLVTCGDSTGCFAPTRCPKMINKMSSKKEN